MQAVVAVVKAVIPIVIDVAKVAMAAVKAAAQALLPKFNPSVSFTIPISLGPREWQLTDSPWGDAYQIYQYQEGEGDLNYGIDAEGLEKLTGTDDLLTINIDGVEQEPVPGVTLYCVECGITGSLKTTGSASFTLIEGFTAMKLGVAGNIHAAWQLGVDAYADWEHDIASIRLLEVGVPGFFIPEVITVGPMLTLDIDATIEVEAQGQLLIGSSYSLEKFSATVDFFNHANSNSRGFTPVTTHVFNASGEVTATASLGLPIGVGVGIDIFDGKFSKEVALVDRPSIEVVADWQGSYVSNDTCSGNSCNVTTASSENDGTCDGITWYVNFANDLEFDLFGDKYSLGGWQGPNLASGCIGTSESQDDTSSSASSTATADATADATASVSLASISATPTAGTCNMDQVIINGGFDDVAADGSAFPWTDQPSYEVSMTYTEDDLALSAPNSA